jgi:hypothetical protein
MAHFLDHYHRLGIGCFLVILHGSRGDGSTNAVLRELDRYAVRPVLCVTSYSGALKRRRVQSVVRTYCHDDDWVVYADGDEFQIYPSRLHDFTSDLERRGLDYATGQFFDRVTSDGALAPIRRDTSIWQQFPCVAPVTRELTRGETRKVCIARAYRKLGDGGPHSLAMESGIGENTRRTHAGPWSEPMVEIHHFKWDATLRRRLDDKLHGGAGDRDRIDGAGFMVEYRRLANHLTEEGGKIALHSMARTVTPAIAFERPPLGQCARPTLMPPKILPLVSSHAPRLAGPGCRRLW